MENNRASERESCERQRKKDLGWEREGREKQGNKVRYVDNWIY